MAAPMTKLEFDAEMAEIGKHVSSLNLSDAERLAIYKKDGLSDEDNLKNSTIDAVKFRIIEWVMSVLPAVEATVKEAKGW